MPIRATFSRPSATWQGDAPMARVAVGVPRYEDGMFGNQLTAAQARLTGPGWSLEQGTVAKGSVTFDTINGGVTLTVTDPGGLLANELLYTELTFPARKFCGQNLTLSATVTKVFGTYVTAGVGLSIITNTGTEAFTNATTAVDGRLSVTRAIPAVLTARTRCLIFIGSSTQTIANGFSVRFTLAQAEVGSTASAWQPGPGSRSLALYEGTSNLLGAGPSNFNSGLGGWVALNSGAVTPDTVVPLEGAGCMKVVCANAASSGAQFVQSTGLPASGTFTYSAHYRGETGIVVNGMTLEIVCTYTTGSPTSATVNVTPDPNSYKRAAVSITSNNALTLSTITLRARSNGTQNGLVTYWDAMQLEQKAAATAWTRGGVDRAPAVVTVPGRDTINASEGTIEGWYWVDPISTATRSLVDTKNPGTGFAFTDAIGLSLANGTTPTCYYGTGSNYLVLQGGTAPLGVWLYLAFRWRATSASLWLNGAQVATSSTPPALAVPPSVLLGGNVLSTTPDSMLNGNIGGLRFSRVYRTDAECLAQYTSLDPFVRDAVTMAVFDFDGRLREPLPDFNAQCVAEADFVTPVGVTPVTASSTLANYPAGNVLQYDFPTQTWRSNNSLGTQTLTFDFGDVVALAGVFIFAANFEGLLIETSVDGTVYSPYPGGPYGAVRDLADDYRKCLVRGRVQTQFVKITVISQIADDGAAYLESGSVIFFSDLNALPRQFTDYTVSTERHYLSDESGGHLDTREAGPQFVTVTFAGRWEMSLIREARQMGLFGQGKPFLFFLNIGNPEETYLLQMTRSVTYKLSGITFEGNLECRSRA